jgi:hypothetical protein
MVNDGINHATIHRFPFTIAMAPWPPVGLTPFDPPYGNVASLNPPAAENAIAVVADYGLPW